MFESSLVQRKRSRRWGWTLAAAVTLHGMAATAVVLASVWNVPSVDPPQLLETVYVTLPPPPMGNDTPPPPKRHEAAPQPPKASTVPQPPQVVTQPPEIPNTLPPHNAAPPADDVATADTPQTTGGDDAGPGVPWGSQQGNTDDTPIELGADMTRPEVIQRVMPLYTEAARLAHRQGVVIVRATIDRQGRVTDVRVLKPLGLGLDESAVAAVQQWRFRPATLGGRPLPVYFQLSVTFTVR
jgi:TonB family protein